MTRDGDNPIVVPLVCSLQTPLNMKKVEERNITEHSHDLKNLINFGQTKVLTIALIIPLTLFVKLSKLKSTPITSIEKTTINLASLGNRLFIVLANNPCFLCLRVSYLFTCSFLESFTVVIVYPLFSPLPSLLLSMNFSSLF